MCGGQARLKIRFQADADIDPDIRKGLLRREPSIDFRPAAGTIPEGTADTRDTREQDRSAYLESACGDDQELRGEVELLLAKETGPSGSAGRLKYWVNSCNAWM
jgi:hypothetical protein